jgi:DNA-binding transcriptional LysR family regulator
VTLDFHDLKIVFGHPRAYGAQSDPLEGEVLTPMATPDRAAQIATWEDVTAFPLIEVATHRAGWAHVFDSLAVRPGPVRWVHADNTLIAAALASAGAGIALARAPASDAIMSGAGLVPCLPDLAVPGTDRYHLVYEDRRSLRPAARLFRDWLLDGAQDPAP